MKDLPIKFVENLQDILKEDYSKFESSLSSSSPVSVRFNPLKPYQNDFETDGKVLWSENGYYLKDRPKFTLDPAFHAGAYYVQEASSMFIEYVFKNYVDHSRPLRVLDLSAAPGGKATLLASLLKEDDVLVANEVIKSRVKILKENLTKWGYPNTIVTNQDPETFIDLEGFFDVVLVDAPCSGEGLFRKNPDAVKEWSEENVLMCSARQKRILSAAGLLVAPDGLLIYSTCTYNSQENQENAEWLTRTFPFETIPIDFPEEWGIVKADPGLQFFPHKVRGEGFYVAAFRNTNRETGYKLVKPTLHRLPKNETASLKSWIHPDMFDNYEYFIRKDGRISAISKTVLPEFGTVLRALHKRSSGLELGLFKGKNFIPDHSLALSGIVSDKIPRIELSKEEALLYLKKENIETSQKGKGWALANYRGLDLGWLKIIGNRTNNYLPTELRIKMDLGF